MLNSEVKNSSTTQSMLLPLFELLQINVEEEAPTKILKSFEAQTSTQYIRR